MSVTIDHFVSQLEDTGILDVETLGREQNCRCPTRDEVKLVHARPVA